MSATFQFLSGAFMMACLVGSLFFFKSWTRTRDRIFFFFGLSFLLMSVERVVLLVQSNNNLPQDHAGVYLIRLVAFGIIIWGIRDKNRPSR